MSEPTGSRAASSRNATDQLVVVSLADLRMVFDKPPRRDGACAICGQRSVAHYCKPEVEAWHRLQAIARRSTETPGSGS